MCRIANLLHSGGRVYFIPEEMPKLSDIIIKTLLQHVRRDVGWRRRVTKYAD